MMGSNKVKRTVPFVILTLLFLTVFFTDEVYAEGEGSTFFAPALQITEITRDTVVLQWDRVEDASGYLIYRSGRKNGNYKLVMDTTLCSFMDRGLRHGKTYYYRIAVCYIDEFGQRVEREWSPAAAATTRYLPVTLSGGEVTASKATLSWSKRTRAEKYVVYYAPKKKGNYKKIATTKDTSCTITRLKEKKKYFFKVIAVGHSTARKRVVSEDSNLINIVTKPKVRKTAYVGDSVMSGMDSYGVVKGKGKKVICKIGVNTYNFYNGSIMDTLLDYQPDRMYIMLGMNSLVGSPNSVQLDGLVEYYSKIIKECKRGNKDIQIVILSVSPTRSTQVKNSSVKMFNNKIKALAKREKVYYYDYTSFLKDSDGRLSKKYAIEDGIHWNLTAYQIFKKRLDAYGKGLD
ncbi:MAG: fibronectin type III domain-containing protein [Lachnospira sp.]|nr:fibronectin type III domain-containing protein [Lachnospira sp.]